MQARRPSWAEPVQVTREQCHLPYVRRAGQQCRPPLEPDCEPAVRRHAVPEYLQVTRERPGVQAAIRKSGEVVLMPVQSLAARHDLGPAEEQIKTVGVTRPLRVAVGIERLGRQRIAGYE